MAWGKKGRALPGNWSDIRGRVLRANSDCVFCGSRATEVDHIRGRDDHSFENLQAVCSPCHKIKTKREAKTARQNRPDKTKRPSKPHPGYF